MDLHGPLPTGHIVHFHIRAEEGNYDQIPQLSIVPHAGKWASVVVGSGCPRGRGPFPIVLVNEADFGEDFIRESRENTTSGDPLGEAVLARPDRQTMAGRRFIVEYGAISSIDIAIRESPTAILVVDILVRDQQVVRKGKKYPTLDMTVRFSAANVVSFWFQEATATLG